MFTFTISSLVDMSCSDTITKQSWLIGSILIVAHIGAEYLLPTPLPPFTLSVSLPCPLPVLPYFSPTPLLSPSLFSTSLDFSTSPQILRWHMLMVNLKYSCDVDDMLCVLSLLMKLIRDVSVFQYFYSIKDISIGGLCVCLGRAKGCEADLVTGVGSLLKTLSQELHL